MFGEHIPQACVRPSSEYAVRLARSSGVENFRVLKRFGLVNIE
jgi:hypothetical protein